MLIDTSLDDETLSAAADSAAQLVSNELVDVHATPEYRRVLTAELTKRVLKAVKQKCRPEGVRSYE
jgi:CO/xanthine dehydrogenase FAD-binding subunit